MDSEHKVGRYVLTDHNEDLISVLNLIKDNHKSLSAYYAMMWFAMKQLDSVADKSEFYSKLRDKFNKDHNPFDFIVLNRMCYNGLIRYNSKGEFNSPYHMNRDGIIPETFENILEGWSEAFNRNNVVFMCVDYKQINPTNENDFIYLDPPYANTKGMYDSCFSQKEFFGYMSAAKCSYAFSYDGVSGEDNMTIDIPKELYSEHLYIKSGNSSFKRLKGKTHDNVYESLYLKHN